MKQEVHILYAHTQNTRAAPYGMHLRHIIIFKHCLLTQLAQFLTQCHKKVSLNRHKDHYVAGGWVNVPSR